MRLSGWAGRALAIAFLIALYPVLTVIFHGRPSTGQLTAIVAFLLATVAVYVAYWLRFLDRSDWRIVSSFVIVLFVLAIALNLVSAWTVNPLLLALVVAGYGYRFPISVAVVSGLILVSLALSVPPFLALHLSPTDTIAIFVIDGLQVVLIGFVAVGAGWLVSTIRELHQAREQLALLAVDQERARFARDVHDLMGHSLSVITLKGELAQQLVASAPDRARDELRDIVQVARNALREVRETVSGYHQPTLASELAGARAALAAAGIECTIDQAAGALTAATEAVLAWTVREGATNVLRHSKARRCSIVLTRNDDAVQLDVVDDGPATNALSLTLSRERGRERVEAGNGLRGLGERVRAQGGRLEAGPLPHQGFRLRVTLPSRSAVTLAPQVSGDTVL